MAFCIEDLPYGIKSRFNELASPLEKYQLKIAIPTWEDKNGVTNIVDLDYVWLFNNTKKFWGTLLSNPANFIQLDFDHSTVYRVRSGVTLSGFSSLVNRFCVLGNFMFANDVQIDYYQCFVDKSLMNIVLSYIRITEPWFRLRDCYIYPNITPQYIHSLNPKKKDPVFDVALRRHWIRDFIGFNFDVFYANHAGLEIFEITRSDLLRFFNEDGCKKTVMYWEFRPDIMLLQLELNIRNLFKDNFEYIIINTPIQIEFTEYAVVFDGSENFNLSVNDIHQSVHITCNSLSWSYIIRRINPDIPRNHDNDKIWHRVTNEMPSKFSIPVFTLFLAITTISFCMRSAVFRLFLIVGICDEYLD